MTQLEELFQHSLDGRLDRVEQLILAAVAEVAEKVYHALPQRVPLNNI